MLPDDLLAYVRSALPGPPSRVLEVGAGEGELAAALRDLGWQVVAIDPDPRGPGVDGVALHELEAEPFEAAVAVLSLHHVEPLDASLRRLGELVRTGGRLVVDEFDVGRMDERAAGWWIAQRRAAGMDVPHEAADMLGSLADLHPVAKLRAVLAPWFDAGEPVPGPYLHRWGLPPGLRPAEEAAIARGALPATGARLVAARR